MLLLRVPPRRAMVHKNGPETITPKRASLRHVQSVAILPFLVSAPSLTLFPTVEP